LDYVKQISWILFLMHLDDLEKDRATVAELTGKPYAPIIGPEYQWTVWAMPKISAGGGRGRGGLSTTTKPSPATTSRIL
jgi:type I restriction enzyme M protein